MMTLTLKDYKNKMPFNDAPLFLTFQIAMQPSLNHMVMSYPMGIPKVTIMRWIVPGSFKDHLVN